MRDVLLFACVFRFFHSLLQRLRYSPATTITCGIGDGNGHVRWASAALARSDWVSMSGVALVSGLASQLRWSRCAAGPGREG